MHFTGRGIPINLPQSICCAFGGDISTNTVASRQLTCFTFLIFTTGTVACVIVLVVCVSLSVCVYVCLSDDNFRKPWRRKFIFAYAVYLHELQVEFLYEGQIKIKVTGAKKVENSHSRNVKLGSAITPVRPNIQPWCLRAAWVFQIRRIEWCRVIFVTWPEVTMRN